MEKINIAELLRNCPKGMELDCPLFENLEFERINKDDKVYPIICRVKTERGSYNFYSFNIYGCYSTEKYSKCVIFPKGKTTWEGFVPPIQFKDGDIVATQNGIWIGIHKRMVGNAHEVYFAINHDCLIYNDNIFCFERLATEEEKQKLFDAIKANGYKWNEETKTLEKLPKFKVRDRIKYIYFDRKVARVVKIHENRYELDNGKFLDFQDENAYEISYDKFDINTLKPFDKVLVRDFDNTPWEIDFFSRLLDGKHFKCVDLSYVQCIPYEENKHLLGTTDDCDEYYKTW